MRNGRRNRRRKTIGIDGTNKGPEISRIEIHDERTKEKYASNPDVDTTRSHLNYHLIEPKGHYRYEAESRVRTGAGAHPETAGFHYGALLYCILEIIINKQCKGHR